MHVYFGDQKRKLGTMRTLGNFFLWDWAARAQLLQSFPALCNHLDPSLPGSSVHGILQARILEWVAISSSRGYS